MECARRHRSTTTLDICDFVSFICIHVCFNLFHVPTTCAVFLHGRKIVSPSNMTNSIFHLANGQFIDVFCACIQKPIVNEMESNYGKVVCIRFAIFGVNI